MTDGSGNRFAGTFLGLALGDAFGAPYEGGPLERILWSLIGTRQGKLRFTDDTQMSIDLAESLLDLGRIDGDDLARRFCRSYRWDRGYGPGTVRVLRRIRRGMPWEQAAQTVFHGGSFGNGGAMRAPVIGLFFSAYGDSAVASAAKASAAVTHSHRLAKEGAGWVALATTWGLQGKSVEETMAAIFRRSPSREYKYRLDSAAAFLASHEELTPRQIICGLGCGTAALNSCVTAIYLSLAYRGRPFDALLQAAISLGGDVDTIAAMAGAIWGAYHGADQLPAEKLARLEQCDRIRDLAIGLARAVENR